MSELLKFDLGSKFSAQVRKLIRPATILLDVGAGIRPQSLIPCEQHICIEPHSTYANVLRAHGYTVIGLPVPLAFATVREADTICMFDVLEHLPKKEGAAALAMAKKLADQVVVFTTLGFQAQSGDAWGMDGDYWQEHRSGWMPEEFVGWKFVVDRNYHDVGKGAFCAVYRK